MTASATVVVGSAGTAGPVAPFGGEAVRRQLEELRHGYVARLPEAVRAIEDAVAGGQDAHVLVHRLRGSAAVYDCLEISRVAADLEALIVRSPGGGWKAASVGRHLARLRRAVDRTVARREHPTAMVGQRGACS